VIVIILVAEEEDLGIYPDEKEDLGIYPDGRS
jgi:hypothetical protein